MWVLLLVAAASAATVPIERLESGLVVVEVEAQPPMRFIVDTGAGITILTPASAERLGAVGGHTVQAQAVGGTVPVRITTCPELVVASAVFRDLPVGVMTLPEGLSEQLGSPVDGILGRSWFEQADVALDLNEDQLSVHPVHTFDHDDAFVEIPFRLSRGMIQVRVGLGSASGVRTVLDLGANTTMANRAATVRAGLPQGPGDAWRDTRGASVGADGEPVPWVGEVSADVDLEGLVLDGLWLQVCEDDPCRTLLDGRRPTVHLGMDAVAGRILRISYAERRLFLSR